MDIVMMGIGLIWMALMVFCSGVFIHLGWQDEKKEHYIILGLIGWGMVVIAFALFKIIMSLETIKIFLR